MISRDNSRSNICWTFGTLYLICLLVISLLMTVAGGKATYFGALALLSCGVCLTDKKALRIVAVIGTALAIGFAITDHEGGMQNKSVRQSALELRLRDCEKRLQDMEGKN
jgi:hypothetical protein